MEKEENKNVCCENKGACVCDSKTNKCCCSWRKCHMMRKIFWVVMLIVAFGLGSQWGEMKSETRGYRSERGGMMNWGGNRYEKQNVEEQKAVGEVTVDVTKTPTAPKQ
jgi:hypothetical protein